MDLKCTGPLICELLKTVNTTELHDLWLDECADVEPWIWRNHGCRGLTICYKWIFNCVEDP